MLNSTLVWGDTLGLENRGRGENLVCQPQGKTAFSTFLKQPLVHNFYYLPITAYFAVFFDF